MKYNDLTRRCFEQASCAGVLAGEGVYRGAAGSRGQGTWVNFDVQVDGTRLPLTMTDVRFRAFGCPHVIAVCEWLARQAIGLELGTALPAGVTPLSLGERFELPVPKRGRLLIIEDAWLAAMRARPSAGAAP